MKLLKKGFIAALCISLILISYIIVLKYMENTKELDIEEYYDGRDGTMVLKNLKNNKVYIYNKDRGQKRFTPESTFKVPNALIGLEVSAVRDEYDVKRWDGVEREFDSWNRDHSLASAMRESVIWYYQEMAKDIGESSMQENVNIMEYGNKDITGGIDKFWLDSSLEISAVEQVEFMENLVKEELPFEEEHQKTVKRMMIQKENDNYVLYGKTGTRLSDNKLGWFVGFIKLKDSTWVFATNISDSGSEAMDITLKTLKQMKLIK